MNDALKENRWANFTILGLHYRLSVGRQPPHGLDRPTIRFSHPENIVPTPHTQLVIGMGEGTAAVTGEFQGNAFG